MKHILSGILAATILSSTLAADIFVNSPYQEELDRMDKYFNSLVKSHLNASTYSNIVYPRVNIQNKPEHYIYTFDLAGVDKKNIQLSIDDRNVLTLSGEKSESFEDKNTTYEKREIFFGSFKRMIQLPKDVDQSKVESKYDNGILTLTIGKVTPIKPKSKIIPIN